MTRPPKARPETPEPAPAPATGIAYLQLVADAHQQQLAGDQRIGFHAIYSQLPEQIPAQPSPDELSLDQQAAEQQAADQQSADQQTLGEQAIGEQKREASR